MTHQSSVSSHWRGGYDEAAIRDWALELRQQLGQPVSLGLIFLSPEFFPHAETVLEIIRVHAGIPVLAGCSGVSQVCGAEEIESAAGITLSLHHLPGARVAAVRFDQELLEQAVNPAAWHLATGIRPESVNGWIAFADPFQLDAETWLETWNEAYPGTPMVGGLASSRWNQRQTLVFRDGEVFDHGGVAVAIGGDVTLATVVSQGCTPMGEPWTITRAERNIIHTIGNRPAYRALEEAYASLSPADQQRAHQNIFVGLVTDEYREEFSRGDFLVRNLIGADAQTGALAVGAIPRIGQTLQFQRRDADAAREDLRELLDRLKARLGTTPVYGGCLVCCNGRGERLFGERSHDARTVAEAFGVPGLAGFFGNGEIGPVGGRNFLHGYTAALALFVKATPA
jgi:small ligand-binding sensory domain FIST